MTMTLLVKNTCCFSDICLWTDYFEVAEDASFGLLRRLTVCQCFSDIIHVVDWDVSVCDFHHDHWTVPLIHMHLCELKDLTVWRTGARLTPSSRPSSLPPPRQIDPLEMDADMQSLGSTTWLLDQRDSNRRPVSTKYETTIFWGRIPTVSCSPRFSLSHTHIHASPVPSHCDGITSLRAACFPLCPAQWPTPTSSRPPPWHSCSPPVPPQSPWQPPLPVAAAARGRALEQVILDRSHFTVDLLSQPNCLFLLILFLLTNCICLQSSEVASSSLLFLF